MARRPQHWNVLKALRLMARIKFTAVRIQGFACPSTKAQAFLWDSGEPSLGLRATAAGARAYIFESKLDRRTIRMTIGNSDTWSIPAARTEAGRLKALVNVGKDPRSAKAETIEADRATRATEQLDRQRLEVTGFDAWTTYCEEGRAHGFRKGPWSDLHYRDHIALASAGGEPMKRGAGKTKPGPLATLLRLPLASIDAERLEAWVKKESAVRPTRTRLAFRLLRAFLNWCSEHAAYKNIARPDAAKARRARDKLGKPNAKTDALQKEQLGAWFAAVQQQSNPVIASYLQSLLLVGSRPEELMSLRWKDVDFRWKSITIRDKVEGERTVPLTPYVAHLLGGLPRRPKNPWVFSSPAAASGRLQDPSDNHGRAVRAAALPHLTLHGLRRSFGSLSEWVECPVGIVAQIQGHKPSAIAEKHYRVRPLDLLRVWHERIEAWVLNEAGVMFDPTTVRPNGLRVAA